MALDAVGDGFIARNKLWSNTQAEAAAKVLALVEEHGLRTIRVAVADPQGKIRGKTLTPRAFRGAMKDGLDFTTAQFNFDSAEGIAYNPFTSGGSLAMEEMEGFPDVTLVPDPATFRILPWASGTGWILGDMHFPDGSPVPFDARHKLKYAVEALEKTGHCYVAGLEIEFTVCRVLDPMMAPEHMGSLGFAPEPPKVEPLFRGFAYQCEAHLEVADELLNVLADHCEALGLPLRTMENEMGPGQLEFTFDVTGALEAADNLTLFRSMVKQVCARMGLHATFMTQPGLPAFFASGWHLHQSLSKNGINAFASAEGSGDLLSPTALNFVGGLLAHAVEASVFTTPTVNGYKRRRPNSLAPDRATWGYDNRAAMIRVQGGPGLPSTHVENRIGEPAANPYLYLASQILSGLDGLDRHLDPGPMEHAPYEAKHRPELPKDLFAAVEALDKGTFFRGISAIPSSTGWSV